MHPAQGLARSCGVNIDREFAERMHDEGLLGNALQAGVLTRKSWSSARLSMLAVVRLCWAYASRADGSRVAQDSCAVPMRES